MGIPFLISWTGGETKRKQVDRFFFLPFHTHLKQMKGAYLPITSYLFSKNGGKLPNFYQIFSEMESLILGHL